MCEDTNIPDCLLAPAPACAFFAVFDGDAQLFQTVADLVGERPEFLFADFAAYFHQQVDEFIGAFRACLFAQAQSKDAGEFVQQVLSGFELGGG